MMDKISVIIPVYNVQDYLEECVNSILAQTYTNLEIILVDDGSKDNSGQLCDAFSKRDSRVKVIHKENGGVSTARNAGIESATGEYIAFVDADDYIAPDMYSRLMNLLKYFGADFCFSNRTMNQCEPLIKSVYVRNNTEALRKFNSFSFEGDDHIPNSIWGGIISSAIVKKLRFPDDIHHYEDYYMQKQYLSASKVVVITNEPFYYYRIREGSANRSDYNIKVASCMKIADYLKKNKVIKDRQEYDDTTSFFIAQCYFSLAQSRIRNKELSDQLRTIIKENQGSIKRSRSIKEQHKLAILIYPLLPFSLKLVKCLFYK